VSSAADWDGGPGAEVGFVPISLGKLPENGECEDGEEKVKTHPVTLEHSDDGFSSVRCACEGELCNGATGIGQMTVHLLVIGMVRLA